MCRAVAAAAGSCRILVFALAARLAFASIRPRIPGVASAFCDCNARIGRAGVIRAICAAASSCRASPLSCDTYHASAFITTRISRVAGAVRDLNARNRRIGVSRAAYAIARSRRALELPCNARRAILSIPPPSGIARAVCDPNATSRRRRGCWAVFAAA